jgi:hypothetical protein
MLEADVTLAETTRYPIPIMAHPPVCPLSSQLPGDLTHRNCS